MTEWKFVNDRHEHQYHKAVRLLASEDERQGREVENMSKAWERLPEDERMERIAWLRGHFQDCRKPYIKLLTDILALATPVMVVSAEEADRLLSH